MCGKSQGKGSVLHVILGEVVSKKLDELEHVQLLVINVKKESSRDDERVASRSKGGNWHSSQ